MPPRRFRRAAGLACLCALLAGPGSRAFGRAASELPADRGAAGTWQKLRKLQTTASAMHTTAQALEKWGKEDLLREVVRVVRIDLPLVLIARFQGNARDGHGNHMAAGLVTQEAFRAAGDPAMFPEHAAEGLRPWPPLKLYIGGVRENEDWTIRTDAGEYSPWLGDSYNNFARIGLSSQRSQNGGQLTLTPGSSFGYYRRLASTVTVPDKETSFFDGIDTRLSGLFAMLQRPAPAGAAQALGAIERNVDAAASAFTVADPSASVPALAAPAAVAVARYNVAGVAVEAREALRRREAQLPYGYALREVRVVPALAVNLSPSTAVIPLGGARRSLALQVELIGNVDGALDGTVALELPPGWTASPTSRAFRFARPGERSVHAFEVAVPALAGRAYELRAVATAAGKQYREGYQIVEHRDLETRYLYRPAQSEVPPATSDASTRS